MDETRPSFSVTKTDLGEDLLLEKTRVLPEPGAETVLLSPGEESGESEIQKPLTADQLLAKLEDAKILLSEGLIGEAKKNLRKILEQEPVHSEAHRLLDSINLLEEKKLLDEKPTQVEKSLKPMDLYEGEAVLKKLELDLGLIEFEQKGQKRPTLQIHELQTLSFRDKMDLAIAYKEMELLDQAASYLEGVCRAIFSEPVSPEENQKRFLDLLEATHLLAEVYQQDNRATESKLILDAIARDDSVDSSQKVGIFYLLAKANLILRNQDEAVAWLNQVIQLSPNYRDAKELLRSATLS